MWYNINGRIYIYWAQFYKEACNKLLMLWCVSFIVCGIPIHRNDTVLCQHTKYSAPWQFQILVLSSCANFHLFFYSRCTQKMHKPQSNITEKRLWFRLHSAEFRSDHRIGSIHFNIIPIVAPSLDHHPPRAVCMRFFHSRIASDIFPVIWTANIK